MIKTLVGGKKTHNQQCCVVFMLSHLTFHSLRVKVHLAYKVLVDSQELVALREKRVLLACLEFLASPDRREILVFQEIR